MLRLNLSAITILLLGGCIPSFKSPSTLSATSGSNPYEQGEMYVNPLYVASVQSSIDSEPAMAESLRKVQQISTAYWITEIQFVSKIRTFLEGARATKQQTGKSFVVTFVIYDLPERDCAASASAGELSVGDLDRYKREFIDPIAQMFSDYRDLKIVALVEPDSLANLATNMSMERCIRAQYGYKEGVAYAIRKLNDAGAEIYLDSAHSGWLGWPDNRRKMAAVVREVLEMAGGVNMIRGFVTNLANYSPLSIEDGSWHNWYDSSNPAKGELPFVRLMTKDYQDAGIDNPRFVIDTSRNGVVDSRQTWGSWCNVARAGLGERPRVNPKENVDAYLWVKTPGESDGSSDPSGPRYSPDCNSYDSLQGAPQAGEWFHNQFILLAKNATPYL